MDSPSSDGKRATARYKAGSSRFLLNHRFSISGERIYTGKDFDSDTGLYYFNARWYDAETGRFLSEDPIQDGDNWYAYCGNNPLTNIDETGLAWVNGSYVPDGAVMTDADRYVNQTVEFDDAADKTQATKRINDTMKQDLSPAQMTLLHNFAAQAYDTYHKTVSPTLKQKLNSASEQDQGKVLRKAFEEDIDNYFGGIGAYDAQLNSRGRRLTGWQNSSGIEDNYGFLEGWGTGNPNAALLSSGLASADGHFQSLPGALGIGKARWGGSPVVPETTVGGAWSAFAKRIHGNDLNSPRPTWGYKLFKNSGEFLKNGITSKTVAERRYSIAYMKDKYMETRLFPNRKLAYDWEYQQNQLRRGPLNFNMH